MHPINNNNFGPNGISVSFNNGTRTLSGFIVKQLSQTRYVVSDGSVLMTIHLAKTVADATALPAGVGTFMVTPFNGPAEHGLKLLSRKVYTVEGNVYMWNLTGATAAGEASLTTVAAATAAATQAAAATAAATATAAAAAAATAAAATPTPAPAATTTPTTGS